MRASIAVLSLSIFLGAAVSSAQNAPQAAPQNPPIDYSAVNCSGFVTDQKVPDGIQIVSGEQSNYKIVFSRGEYVHINRGQDKGVRVGDRFSVVRPDKDPTDVPWFKWQAKLLRAMGSLYMDAGQVKVVNVQPKVSGRSGHLLVRLHAARRISCTLSGSAGTPVQGSCRLQSASRL